MAGIFFKPISRRRFLTRSSQAVAACAITTTLGGALSARGQTEKSLHLALLSDTHIAADPKDENRKFLPTENLKTVVAQVLESRPQAAIVDGDAARLSGEMGDYEALHTLLTPLAQQCPVYIALGNHDNRENFLKVFPQDATRTQKVSDKHVLVLEEPFLRVILLDSLLYVNKVAGLLGRAQREWLDKYLATVDGRPTVLIVHHTLGENDGELLDVEALFRIVRPYSKVKAIFYGHSHQYVYRQRDGIHLVNLPAIGYNFNDQEPVGWVDAFFAPDGAKLTLKAIGGNRDKDGQTTALTWRGV